MWFFYPLDYTEGLVRMDNKVTNLQSSLHDSLPNRDIVDIAVSQFLEFA
jgi:hypothetical protein